MTCRDTGSEDRCENLKFRREEDYYVTANCAVLLQSLLCYCEVCYVTAKCVVLLQSALCYCEVCRPTVKCAM